MKSKKPATWSNAKTSLSSMDRAGLVGVIRDLYEASAANRRFLHARFVPAAATLDEYRDLVEKAVFPDPLSQRPIRLRDAAATITDYKRSERFCAALNPVIFVWPFEARISKHDHQSCSFTNAQSPR